MEEKKNLDFDIDFEQVELEHLEEIEEVITPAVGTVLCCTS